MNSTVQKWGNSLVLRIPSGRAKDARLQQGSQVEVSLLEEKLIVSPKDRRKPDLTRMLKDMSRMNMHSEHDWGKPMGREA